MSEAVTVSEVQIKGQKAKNVSSFLVDVSTDEKNNALNLIAEQLIVDKDFLIIENEKDLEAGKAAGLTEEVLDRIMLNAERIEGIADGVKSLIDLKDPVGETIESITKEKWLIHY